MAAFLPIPMKAMVEPQKSAAALVLSSPVDTVPTTSAEDVRRSPVSQTAGTARCCKEGHGNVVSSHLSMGDHAGGSTPPVHNVPARPPTSPWAQCKGEDTASTPTSDSDDAYVYVLEHVRTTEEALQKIRTAQNPVKKANDGLFSRGSRGPATSPVRSATDSPRKAAAPRRMQGDLPATMREFYDSPPYTVSLTAAREALFADALSGFHSYVAREEAQQRQLDALLHHPDTHAPPSSTESALGGVVNVHNLPPLSLTATVEWSAAVQASMASPLQPNATLPGEAPTAEAASPSAVAGPRVPVESVSPRPLEKTCSDAVAEPPTTTSAAATSLPGGTSASLNPEWLSLTEEDAAAAAAALVSPEKGVASEDDTPVISASYMFLMRSRDAEVMSPTVSPARTATPQSVTFQSELPSDVAKTGGPAVVVPPQVHVDPVAASPPDKETDTEGPPLPASTASLHQTRLARMQLQALLQERAYQQSRVPEVFRFRYSPEFVETYEEKKLRHQRRDGVLRHSQHPSDPTDPSNATRRALMHRYAHPNALEREWLYVWEQFARDIPRETLFVEETPYHDADDAVAAILSYVEYCYDRGQKAVQRRSEAALADSKPDGGAPSVEKTPNALMAGTAEVGDALTPTKEPNFFESFLSASSTAIKGAVVTMRKSLPDFVGDPLLAVSGYDPAIYYASLLFPCDPKARSEKVFTAAREVVLASQQSFMGFPYQLLCEQVGTERLGLALEALEQDQTDDDHGDGAAEANALFTGAPAGKSSARKDSEHRTGASAAIPMGQLEEAEEEAPLERGTSSVPESRVVRVYQTSSSPSPSSPTRLTPQDGGGGEPRPRRYRPAHAVDEWNVSSASSDLSIPAASAGLPPPAEVTAEEPPMPFSRSLLTPTQHQQPLDARDTATDGQADATATTAMTGDDSLQKAEAGRRRRERRRRRRRSQKQHSIPLLVGEPRLHEFVTFLNITRARVLAKQRKEERERARQEPSEGTSLPADGRKPPVVATRKLPRDDVEGSAYLLPARPTASTIAAAAAAVDPALTALDGAMAPPEICGMRICLFFDEKRNVPMVVVNKLFRLFTFPGLRGLTSSSSEQDDDDEVVGKEANDVAAAEKVGGTPVPVPPSTTRTTAGDPPGREKSLLLLIQVQFPLFSHEAAEVRWKWWKP